MNPHRIDARGLSCPIPVVMAARAIKDGHACIEVAVSEQVAVENLARLAKSSGMSAAYREEDGAIVLTLAR